MPKLVFSISLNSRLVEPAREMHQISRIGDERRGPNQSFEAFLSDLTTVALVERIQRGMSETRSASDTGAGTRGAA